MVEMPKVLAINITMVFMSKVCAFLHPAIIAVLIQKTQVTLALVRGPGAWELKFRYDYTNIQSPFFTQAVNSFIPTKQSGGNYQAYTFGINWFTNTNMSVMGDYVFNYRDAGNSSGSGSFSSFGMRTQFEF
ncbi:hypothetical protein EBS67_10645 [bacterium]|nr:hypothetical protein [bacterium]